LGNLYYEIATTTKESIARYRQRLAEMVKDGRILDSSRV
jgi:hypothetical protein